MSGDLILEFKPKFVGWVRYIALIGVAYVVACAPVMIIWFASIFILPNGVSEPQIWINLAIIYLICMIFTHGILLFVDKKNFEVTSYKVYPDKIEFEEGFINHKYTTIKVEDIKEIHFSQSFIQRFAELGTIRFITAANVGTNYTGLTCTDIENPNVIYAKIKQVHEDFVR